MCGGACVCHSSCYVRSGHPELTKTLIPAVGWVFFVTLHVTHSDDRRQVRGVCLRERCQVMKDVHGRAVVGQAEADVDLTRDTKVHYISS